MNYDLSMNANQLVAFLQKTTSEFTKADIISFIQQKDIRMVNFMAESCTKVFVILWRVTASSFEHCKDNFTSVRCDLF